jgi:hypothetical protein
VNRTILAVATVLAAAGGDFAGSDHQASTNAGQTAPVDATYTASVAKPAMAGHEMAAKTAAEEPGPRFWGR